MKPRQVGTGAALKLQQTNGATNHIRSDPVQNGIAKTTVLNPPEAEEELRPSDSSP